MSQDGCNGTDQTFKVLTKHWNKNIVGITDATWVEKVIFTFPGHVSIAISILLDHIFTFRKCLDFEMSLLKYLLRKKR